MAATINTSTINNTPFPPFITQESYDKLVGGFTLRPDDVFLTTYGKSGTTWLQQIAKLIKQNGEVGSSHIYETCPWFEMSDLQDAIVSIVVTKGQTIVENYWEN